MVDMKKFGSIPISTKTILAKSQNMKFHMPRIFKELCNLVIEVDAREWNKAKKDTTLRRKIMRESGIGVGSILSVMMNGEHHGTLFKRPKEGAKITFFRNCISALIVLEDKSIHFKFFQNGTFKLTGCKTDEQAEMTVTEFMKLLESINGARDVAEWVEPDSRGNRIKDSNKYEYDKINEQFKNTRHVFTINDSCRPRFIFKTVMINIRYNIGFNINREQLDTEFNKTDDFYSAFEPTINPCVNIKSDAKSTPRTLKVLEFHNGFRNGEVKLTTTSSDSYPDRKKTKEHTFLVFDSGVTIQSGFYYEEMEEKYIKFMDIINSKSHLINKN